MGSHLFKMGLNGPKWLEMGQNGLKSVKMGTNQSKWAQISLNGPKWAQMGQKKAQLVTGNDQKKDKIQKNAQLVKMGLNRCRQMDHLKL